MRKTSFELGKKRRITEHPRRLVLIFPRAPGVGTNVRCGAREARSRSPRRPLTQLPPDSSPWGAERAPESLLSLALTEAPVAAALGGAFYLLRYDVRQGASMLRRNSRTIRGWLEEEAGSGGKETRDKMREIVGKAPPTKGAGGPPKGTEK